MCAALDVIGDAKSSWENYIYMRERIKIPDKLLYTFHYGEETEYLENAIRYFKENKIPYIMSTAVKEKFSVKELRAFCESNGIKIYCESNDIVYVNDNFVAIHAVTGGEKIIRLDGKKTIWKIIPNEKETTVSDTIKITMQKAL